MQATEEVGWIVTVLLAIAAIIANTVAGTNLGAFLLITLLAICGVFAIRHERRG